MSQVYLRGRLHVVVMSISATCDICKTENDNMKSVIYHTILLQPEFQMLNSPKIIDSKSLASRNLCITLKFNLLIVSELFTAFKTSVSNSLYNISVHKTSKAKKKNKRLEEPTYVVIYTVAVMQEMDKQNSVYTLGFQKAISSHLKEMKSLAFTEQTVRIL